MFIADLINGCSFGKHSLEMKTMLLTLKCPWMTWFFSSETLGVKITERDSRPNVPQGFYWPFSRPATQPCPLKWHKYNKHYFKNSFFYVSESDILRRKVHFTNKVSYKFAQKENFQNRFQLFFSFGEWYSFSHIKLQIVPPVTLLKVFTICEKTAKVKLLPGSTELLPQLSSGARVSIVGLTSVQPMDWSSLFWFSFTAFLGRTTHLDLLNDRLLNSSPSRVFSSPSTSGIKMDLKIKYKLHFHIQGRKKDSRWLPLFISNCSKYFSNMAKILHIFRYTVLISLGRGKHLSFAHFISVTKTR